MMVQGASVLMIQDEQTIIRPDADDSTLVNIAGLDGCECITPDEARALATAMNAAADACEKTED